MEPKNKGGRGKKSAVRYEKISVSMSPEMLELVDRFADQWECTRSEAIARLIERAGKMWPPKAKL